MGRVFLFFVFFIFYFSSSFPSSSFPLMVLMADRSPSVEIPDTPMSLALVRRSSAVPSRDSPVVSDAPINLGHIGALLKKAKVVSAEKAQNQIDDGYRSNERSNTATIGFPVKIFGRSVKEVPTKFGTTAHEYEATVIDFGSPDESVPDTKSPARFTSHLSEDGTKLIFTCLVHQKEKTSETKPNKKGEIITVKSFNVIPIKDKKSNQDIYSTIEVPLGVSYLRMTCKGSYTTVPGEAFIGTGMLCYTASTGVLHPETVYYNADLSSMVVTKRISAQETAFYDSLYSRVAIMNRALNGYCLPGHDPSDTLYTYQPFVFGPANTSDLYALKAIARGAAQAVLAGKTTFECEISEGQRKICLDLARAKKMDMEREGLVASEEEIYQSILEAFDATPVGQTISYISNREAFRKPDKAEGWGVDVCVNTTVSAYYASGDEVMIDETPGMSVLDKIDGGNTSLYTEHGLPDVDIYVQSLGRCFSILNVQFVGQYRISTVNDKQACAVRAKNSKIELCSASFDWMIPVTLQELPPVFAKQASSFYTEKKLSVGKVDANALRDEASKALTTGNLHFLAHFTPNGISKLFDDHPGWEFAFLIPPPLDHPCKSVHELLDHLEVSDKSLVEKISAISQFLAPQDSTSKPSRWFSMCPLLVAHRTMAGEAKPFYNALFRCMSRYAQSLKPLEIDEPPLAIMDKEDLEMTQEPEPEPEPEPETPIKPSVKTSSSRRLKRKARSPTPTLDDQDQD